MGVVNPTAMDREGLLDDFEEAVRSSADPAVQRGLRDELLRRLGWFDRLSKEPAHHGAARESISGITRECSELKFW